MTAGALSNNQSSDPSEDPSVTKSTERKAQATATLGGAADHSLQGEEGGEPPHQGPPKLHVVTAGPPPPVRRWL